MSPAVVVLHKGLRLRPLHACWTGAIHLQEVALESGSLIDLPQRIAHRVLEQGKCDGAYLQGQPADKLAFSSCRRAACQAV